MNRRDFATTVISGTVAGVALAALPTSEPRRFGIRLLNNENGSWYTWKTAEDGSRVRVLCEGQDAIDYPPEHLHGPALERWEDSMHKLVADGYAEYL